MVKITLTTPGWCCEVKHQSKSTWTMVWEHSNSELIHPKHFNCQKELWEFLLDKINSCTVDELYQNENVERFKIYKEII